jgi:hypothetical protein
MIETYLLASEIRPDDCAYGSRLSTIVVDFIGPGWPDFRQLDKWSIRGERGYYPLREDLPVIFDYMRVHGIPALEPEALAVEVRLLRASVRIIKPEEVNQ